MDRQTVNLGGLISQQLDHQLKRARHQRTAKNFKAAAQSYRHCAKLQTQLAEYAVNLEVKQRQLEVATAYSELANQLEQSSSSKPTDNGSRSNQHQDRIRSFITQAKIEWNDIGNLEECKLAIKSSYAFALVRRPDNINRRPIDKILLYGPPGTGKTMLAAAASNELDATFFSVKVSDLLSKWFGESSQLISELYREASHSAPSVIFLEEFDALAPQRDQGDTGAERRIVSTLLAELDGLTRHSEQVNYVLTIAATNLPWTIDKPILERFGARLIYVPLPNGLARLEILEKRIIREGYESKVSLEDLAERTEGFSGRDLANLCDLAIERMESEENPEVLELISQKKELEAYKLNIEPLSSHHFEFAFERISPRTTNRDVERYEKWRHYASF
ncbi:AAA family ATPase [Chloroflexi bacterium TSY]|nr:AAA family ATPase [Chloroflexi bacterium TSY]